MQKMKPKIGLVLLMLLALAVSTLSLVGLSTQPASAANATNVGYGLPNGHASRWIGTYTSKGLWALCADAQLKFGGSVGYSAVKKTTAWKDSYNGKTVAVRDVARVAWIMHENADKVNQKNYSSAMDATVYSILHKGAYAYSASLFDDRVDATGHGASIRKISKSMLEDSTDYAGPATLTVTGPAASPAVGKAFTAIATLKADYSGKGIPGKVITFTYNGSTKKATTNNSGVAQASFAAANSIGNVNASAADIASQQISYMSPNTAGFQRLLVQPGEQTVKGAATIRPTRPTIVLNTSTAPTVKMNAAGVDVTDTVNIFGTLADFNSTLTAKLYGPFATLPTAASCTPANLVGTVTKNVSGLGPIVATTDPVHISARGYYTWVASTSATAAGYLATTHPCGLAAETVLVGYERVTPVIKTTISSANSAVGDELYDNVEVSGIKLPCVDATGEPVTNLANVACTALELKPGIPAVPAEKAVWVANADGVVGAHNGCYVEADTEVPNIGTTAFYNDTDQVMSTNLPAGATQTEIKDYWTTLGTQVECEAVEVRAGVPAVPAVMAQDSPPFSTTATAELWGPYTNLAEASCVGTPTASVEFAITGNGTFTTPKVTVPSPGTYTWVITMPGSEYIEGVVTPCGLPEESTVAKAKPQIVTQTSSATVTPGSSISDTVVVSNADGVYTQDAIAELWGPYPSRTAMTCTGTPYATLTLPVTGNGEYKTGNVTVNEPGFYTWIERFAEDDTNVAIVTNCGEATETTVVTTQPLLKTKTSDKAVYVGAQISDTLIVSGVVGDFEETAKANLYGPFASKDDITCATKPYASVDVTVSGNGEYVTDEVTVDEAGYYTWHESFVGNDINGDFTHDCGQASETTLVKTPPTPKTRIPSGVEDPAVTMLKKLFG